jgi:ribosomal subunit interface protein
MEIRVSGHQVDTGEALRAHVQERMSAIADKYFSRAISAQVTFGKGPYDHSFVCDIVAHVMQGVILKGSGQAADAHPAFDQAAERVEKQLRRYTRRLKSRNGAPAAIEELPDNAGYTVFEAGDHDFISNRILFPTASFRNKLLFLQNSGHD